MRARLRALLAGLGALVAITQLPITGTTAAFTDQGRVRTAFATGPLRALNITSVSAGRDFTLAVASDGSLWSWGANDVGQLGDGSTTDRQSPVRVAIPGGKQVASASAGYDIAIAVTADGSVYTWGSTEVTAGPAPTLVTGISGEVAGVSAGGKFFLAWTTAGNLWSWGNNGSGRLGRGVAETTYLTPGQVTVANANTSIVGADAGRFGAVAWRATAAVFAWGQDHNTLTGLQVVGVPAGSIKKVVIGFDTKLLLMASGKVYWARGTGTFASQLVLNNGTTLDVDISLGDTYDAQTQVAIWSDGSLFAWLNNASGQYGDGTTTTTTSPRKILLTAAGNPSIASVAAGTQHTIVRTSDGRYLSTGADNRGQLGNGAAPATKTYQPPFAITTWP